MTLSQINRNACFDGWHAQYRHSSQSTHCDMRFAIYLPPQANAKQKVPVVYWLSGLTCTDENFMQKAGAQRVAAELGIAIVAPDTSPRGEQVPDADRYDLGQGAGFYLNATRMPWAKHYHMYEYILHELPALIEANFPIYNKRAICGHSMGGHGALTIALKHPERYSSVSAFAPICHPMDCPWGEQVFSSYLGDERSQWEDYDATVLMAKCTAQIPMLIDQGTEDDFLEEQLKPQLLQHAADKAGYALNLRMQKGYDHSYYFIASFIEEHLRFHAQHLKSQ